MNQYQSNQRSRSESLKEDLNKSISDLETAKTELEEAKSRRKNLEENLEKSNPDLESAKTKLEEAKEEQKKAQEKVEELERQNIECKKEIRESAKDIRNIELGSRITELEDFISSSGSILESDTSQTANLVKSIIVRGNICLEYSI